MGALGRLFNGGENVTTKKDDEKAKPSDPVTEDAVTETEPEPYEITKKTIAVLDGNRSFSHYTEHDEAGGFRVLINGVHHERCHVRDTGVSEYSPVR